MLPLQGAGKTTICKALEKELLFVNGKNAYNIDGDNLRTGHAAFTFVCAVLRLLCALAQERKQHLLQPSLLCD